MNLPPTVVPWVVSLLVNLLVFGLALVVVIGVAFRVVPDTLVRARHLLALLAFAAAAVVPVLATSGVNTLPGSWVWSRIGSPASTPAADGRTTDGSPTPCASRLSPCRGVWIFDSTNVSDSALAAGVLSMWIAGALLLVGRDLAGHVWAATSRRRWCAAPQDLRSDLQLPPDVALYVHPTAGPSVIGWFRPAIILPAELIDELPRRAVAHMVRHELHHVRHRDPLINASVRLTRALFWPSLPLWLLERVIDVEREAYADDTALAACPAVDSPSDRRAEYASVLLAVARWGGSRSVHGKWMVAATHVLGRTVLEHRVARLLRSSTAGGRTRLAYGVAALICGVVALTLVPVVRAGGSLPTVRIAFSPDGRATLIRRTANGETAEPILRRSDTDLRSAATRQVLPALPDPAVEPPAGAVFVLLLIDERGRVMSAQAVAGEGGPVMTQRALDAARQWTFVPALAGTAPTKVVGELSFFAELEPPQAQGWQPLRIRQ